MKCFPLQAALVTVFCHSNKEVPKTRGLKTDYALDRDVARLVKDLTARHEVLGWFPSGAENQIQCACTL